MAESDERSDLPPSFGSETEMDELHRLLASVEELRALLAPLSDEDRQRVLDLARSLRPPRPEV